MHCRRIWRCRQYITEILVRKHFCDFRQDFQMLLGDVVWYQQEYQQIHGFAIRRFKWNRFGQADEGRERRFQSFDAAMRYGNAMPKSSRSQAFTGEQII